MTRTIVCDVDGVLANFMDTAVKIGYSIAGRPRPHIKDWAPTHWDDYGGLEKHEIVDLWKYIESNPDFWYGLSPIVTSDEASEMRYLVSSDYKIYFATNRRLPGAYENTRLWLDKYLGFSQGLVITKRKGEFCRVVDADYYIDDKSENVDCAIWMTDGKTKAYVIDRTTNRGGLGPHSSKARRVKTISEFLEDIQHGR